MLTRDIELTSAILDLVDNSIDGARRVRKGGDYSGLVIRIRVSRTSFVIIDNCGGIDKDDAIKYAFRFGRPSDVKPMPNSIGQFGIGMKRALFKMGQKFRVESKTATAHFVVEEDVNVWNGREDDWDFTLQDIGSESSQIPSEEYGTAISVGALYDNVSTQFSLDHFIRHLRTELGHAHQLSIMGGLIITVNGSPLTFNVNELYSSDDIAPAFREVQYGEVRVQIYAGLSDSLPSDAGWYVYCNGRLVLEADKTAITGWGEGGERTIPRYHNQFARFRGYILFDSDDLRKLPWKTTKDGVDTDSNIYRAARRDMVTIMRPVITFLNKLKEEAEGKEDDRPLERAIAATRKVVMAELTLRDIFLAPAAKLAQVGPRMNTISYKKPASQVERVKIALGLALLRDVGAKTFEYFYENECTE